MRLIRARTFSFPRLLAQAHAVAMREAGEVGRALSPRGGRRDRRADGRHPVGVQSSRLPRGRRGPRGRPRPGLPRRPCRPSPPVSRCESCREEGHIGAETGLEPDIGQGDERGPTGIDHHEGRAPGPAALYEGRGDRMVSTMLLPITRTQAGALVISMELGPPRRPGIGAWRSRSRRGRGGAVIDVVGPITVRKNSGRGSSPRSCTWRSRNPPPRRDHVRPSPLPGNRPRGRGFLPTRFPEASPLPDEGLCEPLGLAVKS